MVRHPRRCHDDHLHVDHAVVELAVPNRPSPHQAPPPDLGVRAGIGLTIRQSPQERRLPLATFRKRTYPMRHVPHLALITILLVQTAALGAAEPTPPEGFRAIFNGTDLAGWHGLNPHSAANLAGERRTSRANGPSFRHWRVENGELVNDGLALRHDRRGVRRHRIPHRIQDRAESRQRHLSAASAGANLGLASGLRSEEPEPQTAPGFGRPVQQHAGQARPRPTGPGGQALGSGTVSASARSATAPGSG